MSQPTSEAAPAFVMFGPDHLLALGAVGAVSALLSLVVRRAARQNANEIRTAICRTVAALLLAYAVTWPCYRLLIGEWRVADSVPLHLCDLAVYVTAAALWAACGSRPVQSRQGDAHNSTPADSPHEPGRPSREQWLFELAYYWGIGGTTQALLTPDLRFGFPHFQFYKFFAGHGLTIVGILMLAAGVGLRPRRGSALRTWAFTVGLLPPVMLFNWLTGSNYMYLCGPPKNASLFDYFGPWPLSVLTLIGVALVMMHLCYAPYWIAERITSACRSDRSNALLADGHVKIGHQRVVDQHDNE